MTSRDVIIKNLWLNLPESLVDEFLNALENLLWQYAGDDWQYRFDIQ